MDALQKTWPVFCDFNSVYYFCWYLESVLCAVLIKPPNVTCQTCYSLWRLIFIDLNASTTARKEQKRTLTVRADLIAASVQVDNLTVVNTCFMESDTIAQWDYEKENKYLANHQISRSVNERYSNKQSLKALSDRNVPDTVFILTIVAKHWNAAAFGR